MKPCPAQIVVALEELRLRVNRCPALAKLRATMQRHDVLANRPVEPFQERGRDLLEWNQLATPKTTRRVTDSRRRRALFDNLPTHSRVRHDRDFLGRPGLLPLMKWNRRQRRPLSAQTGMAPIHRLTRGPAMSQPAGCAARPMYSSPILRAWRRRLRASGAIRAPWRCVQCWPELFEVALAHIRMLLAGEAVRFIEFDIVVETLVRTFCIGRAGLITASSTHRCTVVGWTPSMRATASGHKPSSSSDGWRVGLSLPEFSGRSKPCRNDRRRFPCAACIG